MSIECEKFETIFAKNLNQNKDDKHFLLLVRYSLILNISIRIHYSLVIPVPFASLCINGYVCFKREFNRFWVYIFLAFTTKVI